MYICLEADLAYLERSFPQVLVYLFVDAHNIMAMLSSCTICVDVSLLLLVGVHVLL